MDLQKFFDVFSNIPKPENPYSDEKQFSSMDYISLGENKITSIIAKLLSPHGPHGQKTKFLELFLKKFVPDLALTSNDVIIDPEHRTTTNRRIDLLLEQKRQWVIAIENKPWAFDQENQISDYITYIKTKYTGIKYKFIYLTALGSPPSERSISLEHATEECYNKSLLNYSYYDLRLWLDDCRKECNDIFLERFIINFSVYIRKNVNGMSMPIETNPQQLEFIAQKIDIAKQVADLIYHAKLNYISEGIKSLEQKSSWTLRNDYGNGKLLWFYRKYDFDPKLLICFQFLDENFMRLNFGVSFLSDDLNEIQARYPHWSGAEDSLNDALGVEGHPCSNEWIWLAPVSSFLPANWIDKPIYWTNHAERFAMIEKLADRLEAALPNALAKTIGSVGFQP